VRVSRACPFPSLGFISCGGKSLSFPARSLSLVLLRELVLLLCPSVLSWKFFPTGAPLEASAGMRCIWALFPLASLQWVVLGYVEYKLDTVRSDSASGGCKTSEGKTREKCKREGHKATKKSKWKERKEKREKPSQKKNACRGRRL